MDDFQDERQPSTPDPASALVGELRLPEARGRRTPRSSPDFSVEIVRPLTPSDMDMLLAPPPVGDGFALKEIRSQHHQIARLLATEKSAVVVSQLTGYTPVYIRMLQDDPAFCELLEHYRTEKVQVDVDVTQRLKTLGLSAAEELQRRLEDKPEDIPRSELMTMIDLGLIKPGLIGNGKGTGSGSAVSLNIQFVQPTVPGGSAAFPSGSARPVIEGEIIDPAERVK